MNREEILNAFLLANIPEIITQEEFDDVKKAIKQSQQENQELKEMHKTMASYALDNEAKIDELKHRIDTVIKYVKEHKYYAHTIDIDYLLEILRGEINE